MQKTFIRYTYAIITAAIFLIFLIHCLFTLHSLESQQYNSFLAKAEQVIHTLENNQLELSIMKRNLDVDYLTRAKAAAYVMERQQEVSMNVEEMQYLADLLNVDELHLIDEHGIIVSASVAEYIGIDMADHKQTREFLSILESDDEDAYLIQEAQPNAAKGSIMQYVGVARKGKKGVVQVGFEPTRQMEAQSRNTYEYIFSKFPTDLGEELFAVNADTSAVLGHSAGMDQEFTADYYKLEQLLDCAAGGYIKEKDGRRMYVFSKKYNNILICAALPANILAQKLVRHVLSTLIFLLIIEVIVLLLLNYLVKQQVVNGIHHIMEQLAAITDGNLETKVTVGGNQEFEALSMGINTMVEKLKYENTHDALTGLYKYSCFKQLAAEKIREMPPETLCAAVMMDLDSFKSINDTYGHDAGDKYLQCFAEVMKSMPAEHLLCARRSGDEFCMLIFNCTHKSQVIELLDKFYETLQVRQIRLSPEDLRSVKASGGFACTKNSAEKIETLINQADQALYESKRQGKGTYGEY